MLILGIETSCDETAAAVVRNGREILSAKVLSQTDIHKIYGGVVPEIASRAHIEAVSALTREALTAADVTMDDVNAVAVTNAPGLIGALLVGVNFAKSLAYRYNIPLIPVHHIRGHIAAAYIEYDVKPPFLAFVASGGHTSIIRVDGYTQFAQIGMTRDDAAGEAFDKIARVMGLPYPGGREVDRLANYGDSSYLKIPHAKVEGSELDFSFSGIKTYVINHINSHKAEMTEKFKADISASFTENVIETVTSRVSKALEQSGLDTLVCAGGVMANSHIAKAMRKLDGADVYIPQRDLCGDNAAMIAAQGYYEYASGNYKGSDLFLNAYAVKNISAV